jgi:hypothetical protein
MANSAELLTLVESAISALLTGGASSYSIGSRTVTKLDLAELFKQRDMLTIAASRESGRSPFSLAKFGRTSR